MANFRLKSSSTSKASAIFNKQSAVFNKVVTFCKKMDYDGKQKKEEFYDEKNDKHNFQGTHSGTDRIYLPNAAVHMLLLPASAEDAGRVQ